MDALAAIAVETTFCVVKELPDNATPYTSLVPIWNSVDVKKVVPTASASIVVATDLATSNCEAVLAENPTDELPSFTDEKLA